VICVTLALGGCGDDDAPAGNGDAGLDGGIDAASADASECAPGTTPEMCDFFSGCGCDVAGGQKCSIGPDNRRCAFAGSGTEWATCADDGECMTGTACVLYPASTDRHCLAFCDDDHPCPTGEICFINIVATGGAELGSACAETCSLLTQDCMFDGLNCHTSPSMVPTAEMGVCVQTGPGMQGDSCMTEACAEGFNCITPSGSSAPICARLCNRANGDADCGGLTCESLSGHTGTGICLP
jgi:hypothetical protein